MSETDQPRARDEEKTGVVVTVVGFLLYFAAGLPILVGGLIMPGYAVGILGVIWLAGLILAIRWRDRAGLFLALPFIMVAIWFAVAWLGDTFLGWTA